MPTRHSTADTCDLLSAAYINGVLVHDIAIGAEGLGFVFLAGQVGRSVTPRACHRYEVSSNLCFPGAEPWTWARNASS